MGRHTRLIDFGLKLNLFQNAGGVCHGATIAWMEACFISENLAYDNRLKDIEALPDFESFMIQFNEIKEKNKENPSVPLSENDIKQFEFIGFIEKISAYQEPGVRRALFNQKLEQKDVDKVAKLVASKKLEALGGFEVIASHVNICNNKDICQYLADLAAAIQQSNPVSNLEVGLLLSTETHTVGLVYKISQKGVHGWAFMDINQEKNYLIPLEVSNVIIDECLEVYLGGEFNIITTCVLTTGLNPNKNKFIEHICPLTLGSNRIAEVKHIYPFDLVERLALRALALGDLGALSMLSQPIINQALLKHVTHRGGYEISHYHYVHAHSLMYLIDEAGYDLHDIVAAASLFDYPEVIEACIQKSMDLNVELDLAPTQFDRVTSTNRPPLLNAAMQNNVRVIDLLCRHGVNIHTIFSGNKFSDYFPGDYNIARIAVKLDYVDIIAWLAKHQPDLLRQKDSAGKTLAEQAVTDGKVEILRHITDVSHVLKEDWNTLLCTAALHNQAHMIPFFLSRGLNLNALNQYGYTAAQIAALRGNLEFLSELAQHALIQNPIQHHYEHLYRKFNTYVQSELYALHSEARTIIEGASLYHKATDINLKPLDRAENQGGHLCSSPSIHQYLATKTVDLHERLDILIDLLCKVDELHSGKNSFSTEPEVHGNINLDNILMGDNGLHLINFESHLYTGHLKSIEFFIDKMDTFKAIKGPSPGGSLLISEDEQHIPPYVLALLDTSQMKSYKSNDDYTIQSVLSVFILYRYTPHLCTKEKTNKIINNHEEQSTILKIYFDNQSMLKGDDKNTHIGYLLNTYYQEDNLRLAKQNKKSTTQPLSQSKKVLFFKQNDDDGSKRPHLNQVDGPLSDSHLTPMYLKPLVTNPPCQYYVFDRENHILTYYDSDQSMVVPIKRFATFCFWLERRVKTLFSLGQSTDCIYLNDNELEELFKTSVDTITILPKM